MSQTERRPDARVLSATCGQYFPPNNTKPPGWSIYASFRSGDNDNDPLGESEYAIGQETDGQISWGLFTDPNTGDESLDSQNQTLILTLQANPPDAGPSSLQIGAAPELTDTSIAYTQVARLVIQGTVAVSDEGTHTLSWTDLGYRTDPNDAFTSLPGCALNLPSGLRAEKARREDKVAEGGARSGAPSGQSSPVKRKRPLDLVSNFLLVTFDTPVQWLQFQSTIRLTSTLAVPPAYAILGRIWVYST